ncbi:Holliday junction resolvase RecU [Aerococcus christensenii]|uniref:Holliday junction resolvase RecU n=1 Tax=Aerococcus christensenii TaxID=87541 RepID=UPI0023A91AE6|nr:Holliday junction resolvase RecU [Aerococcus christensenii]WEB71497.1 Holliday junction resolvase RecU [Aerococcus christensenii]
MHYPNGKKYTAHTSSSLPLKVNQPVSTFANRGMNLEKLLNLSNQWYLDHHMAVVYKKPTPIQVVKVDYPKRSQAKITEAYYRQASTTDYNGVYKSYYIDFEAKQANLKTRFSLNNFHPHQIRHMGRCQEQGGITFAILHFTPLGETYLYPYDSLKEDWSAFENHQVASIPLKKIKKEGYLIPSCGFPALDYLSALDQYLQSFNHNFK